MAVMGVRDDLIALLSKVQPGSLYRETWRGTRPRVESRRDGDLLGDGTDR